MTELMSAIGHTEFGGPRVLHRVRVPVPDVGPSEVRVQVAVAAVNPTDAIRRSGMRAELLEAEDRPWVPGMDFAGVVLEVDRQASQSGLEAGDRVMGVISPVGMRGAYAEQVVVPWRSLVPVPAGIGEPEAATLPMTGLTALQSLDRLSLTRGSLLGVTGGTGIYGGYMIQLARLRGLHVVAMGRSSDEELLVGLGAHEVVDREGDVVANFRALHPEGLDGLADGALLNERVMDAVRSGGGMVTLRHFQDRTRSDLAFHPVHIRHSIQDREGLEEIRDLAERRLLTPRVAEVLPAVEAWRAHQALDGGGARGRFVLDFSAGGANIASPH